MRIGVIKESKDQENRVALTPTGARSLVQAGHRVMIQEGALIYLSPSGGCESRFDRSLIETKDDSGGL